MAITKEYNDGVGLYPAYAWPGGYPIMYLMGDGESLCPFCINNESNVYFKDNYQDGDNKEWMCIGHYIHWEGEPEICAHCHAEIPSAYGALPLHAFIAIGIHHVKVNLSNGRIAGFPLALPYPGFGSALDAAKNWAEKCGVATDEIEIHIAV